VNRKLRLGAALPLVMMITGCATIVPTGPDTYMMADIAGWVNYNRASGFCRDQQKDMLPIASSSYYGSLNTPDYPKVFFKCVPLSEATIQEQATQKTPGM